nr:PREDICTED: uncharacterized protein LOC109033885 [Bemisia tabaci]XP_018902274.1 PREDICTED: uncharacterized protein LOC109033885 [Bemisia tabaci]
MDTFLVIATCLALLCTANEVNAETDISKTDSAKNASSLVSSEAEAEAVLDLLNDGEAKLERGYHEKAVLVLGNTGSGKSTLTQFLSGNDLNLTSFETEEGLGDFIIQDTSGRISNGSATMSWTIFPEAMLDSKSGTVFFDCPGFSDTRSAAHDIAATYFTMKTIENIGRVKLLFTVAYSSVRVGQDRHDFMELAEHIVTMVKNLDKFQDSIALVVTKVENLQSGGGIVPDEKIIRSVAGFLRRARVETQQKIESTSMSADRKQLLMAVTKFIEILLQTEGETYLRLGVFRKPDEAGPLRLVNSLKDSKEPLERIIHRNIRFTAHQVKDFGYTISSSSQTIVHDLVETLKDNMASDVTQLKREVEEIFLSREEISSDVQVSRDIFQQAHKVLSGTFQQITTPDDFVKRLISNTRTLNITLSQGPLAGVEKQSRYLEFFSNFGARDILPLEYAQDFPKLLEYLSSTANYYKVLVYLSNALTNCDLAIKDGIEKNVSFAKIPYDQSDSSRKRRQLAVELTFASMLLPQKDRHILDSEYSKIRDIEFNEPKLKRLEQIWNRVALTKMNVYCHKNDGRLTVRSVCLRLSKFVDSLDSLCPGAKVIEIFALDKVFIDSDLKLTGREAQVSIIAPAWEVEGVREIVLNGLPGNKTYTQQKRGSVRGWSFGSRAVSVLIGEDGADGPDGSSAGSLLGIADRIINGKLLHIFSIGGQGGPGQDGGDGGPGADGTIPEWGTTYGNLIEDSHCTDDTGFWNSVGAKDYDDICTVTGHKCRDGGDGGSGGAGGRGGESGQVLLIGDGQDMISRRVRNGESGRPGTPGRGGPAGSPGRTRRFRKYRWILGTRQKLETRGEWYLQRCSAGKDGSQRLKPSLSPQSGRKLPSSATIDSYKSFVRENPTLISASLSQFLKNTLESHKAVKDLYAPP